MKKALEKLVILTIWGGASIFDFKEFLIGVQARNYWGAGTALFVALVFTMRFYDTWVNDAHLPSSPGLN